MDDVDAVDNFFRRWLMSNLTSDRDTEFVDELHRDEIPMAAGVKI